MTFPRVPWEFDPALPGHFNRVWREIIPPKEEKRGRGHTLRSGAKGQQAVKGLCSPPHLFAIAPHSHIHALGPKGAHLFFPTSGKECLPGNFGAMFFIGW